jgi:hypothetical protein
MMASGLDLQKLKILFLKFKSKKAKINEENAKN